MIAVATISQTKALSSSEIFRLNFSNLNIMCFQLKPEIEQEEGISLSFHLSRILPHIVVIWDKPYFYALGKFKNSMQDFGIEWEAILEQIAAEGIKDFSDRTWQFQEVQLPKAVSANVISLLAYQVLKTSKPYPFSSITALSKNGVQVRREAKFWAEPIEIHGTLQPAITLTMKSKFLLTKTLADFYLNHPEKHNPEKLLIDLNVRSLSDDIQGNGTITQLIKEPSLIHKQKLIEQAKNEISKKALQDDLSNKLLVAVKFGKGKKLYEYGMTALRPCVTSETASRFGVNWGELLKKTKISYKERTDLLATYKKEAENALNNYGFELGISINSRHYPELFSQPQVPIENTPLLFGNGFISTQNKILTGLSRGGVYRRHNKFSDPSRPIRITVLNICEVGFDDFIQKLKERLKSYKFESLFDTKSISLKNLSDTQARAKVEEVVNELMEISPEIVLAFLPQSDRNADEEEGGSLYHKIYDLLLRRQIASQMIYEDTLKNPDYSKYKNILNQVVPGILAKVGNLPFVLAEPLPIADYFIGLDISRESKSKLAGTVNACASIRLHGKQGGFIRYRLEDALIEGEEIPKRVLEKLLPAKELEGKTVLIHRDGRFCGQEVANLLEWAEAIGCKLILVECKKSGSPRLYNFVNKTITAPEKGLALRVSSTEAVLVTTQVTEEMGLADPLRLTVITANHPALISPPIEQVVEITLKLTLLHHGALKMPRLPMPVYGAHKMAKLRLRGIYPSSMLEGDCQFWH
ncbi:Piwi domain-containing protein [Calothrix sp. PCC 7507]|uniref:Piwi domain-containing protein n=1 Tax=Calothrix sp. PCC 7507 TaxID=99598 RepID=UPI00029F49C4|nr:Piwi domain-containing protein [Calothrix sp. PCC 7507]AFY32165.1 stem cell self-renewal protein Piwi [Calothrix sp. PCC 7507]